MNRAQYYWGRERGREDIVSIFPLTFVPTTRFLTPSMYFDPVLMRCENIVLMEEEEPEARDWARGLAAILVKALQALIIANSTRERGREGGTQTYTCTHISPYFHFLR